MEILLLLGFIGFVIWAIAAAVEEAKSSPDAVAKSASRFDQELRGAVQRADGKRSIALLRALPRWPPRDTLLAAIDALHKLRSGTVHASAAGVPDLTVRDIKERSADCEHALCLVAVRMLATRLQSEQTRFKALPDRSRAALLRDADEMGRITAAARSVQVHLTDLITSNPTRNGSWSLSAVGGSLAALEAAAARIVSEEDWQ
jgi:hypothetical protein